MTKAEWNLLPKAIQGRIDEVATEVAVRNILNKPPEVPVWTGPRPWARETVGKAAEWPSEARYLMGYAGGGLKQPMEGLAPPLGATQQLQLLNVWSKMSEELAKATTVYEKILAEEEKDRPYLEARRKWYAGEITTEEWRPIYMKHTLEEEAKSRMETFQDLRMRRLTEIEKLPEAPGAVRAQVYEQMFGIALGKGEYGKAEGFLSKALDAMKEGFKEQAGFGKSIKDNTKSHEDNTEAVREWVRAIKEGKAVTNIPEAERQTIREQAQRATTPGETFGTPQDEIRYSVERGMWINE